jgi:hypothetical protein
MWRLRQELWNWFNTPGFQDDYTFTGSTLRFGASRETPRTDLLLELSQVSLLNLPHRASAPIPQGQLGLGASYFDANGGQDATLFVKQAYWRGKGLGARGNSLRVGRFEFIDGTETVPKDPSLAYLKRERVAHRLLGNFGFSHVQRSFDGGQFVRNTPGFNLTTFAGIPTRGVFDLNGMDTLPDVRVGYAAGTLPFAARHFQGEARLFGLYYNDTRDVMKADNRPLPARATEFGDIQIGTVGGHALGLWQTPVGQVDGLLWAAGQFGEWGPLSHRAFAVAAEAGIQPKRLPGRPWLRAGFFHGSGDGDPGNRSHGTFMPILPTPRVYARFPFYTQANLNDLFGQVLLRPNPRLTLRADLHALWLADPSDLWYSGGGAFQDRPSFGYGGRPSNGRRGLATVADISIDYQWRKGTTFTAYVGYAAGGGVITSQYDGRSGLMAYLEVTQKF